MGDRPLDVARVIGILEPGGAQLSALRLSVALQAHGITSRLYAGSASREGLALAADFDVDVEVYGGKHLQWVPLEAFADWLAPRTSDVDVVHGHMFGAWWAAGRTTPEDVPLVASEHNAVTWPYGDHTAEARDGVRRATAFFAHGPASRTFARRIGVADNVLLDGRSIIEAHVPGPDLDLPSPRITFTGRLHPEKGADVLVEALALMSAPPPAFIVGDGTLRAQLEARVEKLGLTGRVTFPGWVATPSDYVAGSSVHVVPSREEAWSQSAVVALALGVPVVASDVEGLPMTLAGGRGVLVPPEDPPALARAIEAVLAGRDVPDRASGRRYAARFTAERVGDYYADFYRRICAVPLR